LLDSEGVRVNVMFGLAQLTSIVTSSIEIIAVISSLNCLILSPPKKFPVVHILRMKAVGCTG
jgi:hypothetical protein